MQQNCSKPEPNSSSPRKQSACALRETIFNVYSSIFFQDVLIRIWLLPTCSVNKIFGNDHFFFRLHLCFCNCSLVSSRVCLFKNVMGGCKNGEHVYLFAGYWEYRCWSIWSEPFLWTASIGQFRPAELLGCFGIILDLKNLLFSQISRAPSSLDQCHEVLILFCGILHFTLFTVSGCLFHKLSAGLCDLIGQITIILFHQKMILDLQAWLTSFILDCNKV